MLRLFELFVVVLSAFAHEIGSAESGQHEPAAAQGCVERLVEVAALVGREGRCGIVDDTLAVVEVLVRHQEHLGMDGSRQQQSGGKDDIFSGVFHIRLSVICC